MTLRKRPVDKESARQLRAELYEAINRGELSIQDAMKIMRKISRLTQADFASHRGVSIKVIKEIERGVGNPTVNTLNKIGEFFGLEVSFVRSERLNASERQDISMAGPGSHVASRTAVKISPSPMEDFRRLVEELEKIKKMMTPPQELRDALKKMEVEMITIQKAQEFFAQMERNRDSEPQLKELEHAMQRIDNELKAVQQARHIMESAERIQQQIQPPPALKKWLDDIDAAKKLLMPLDALSDPGRRI